MSVTVRHLRFRYPGMSRDVLHDVGFEAEDGVLTLILGLNGAGKSTLLKLLNGILHPSEGTISVNGHPLRRTGVAAAQIAVTFQDPSDQIFESTVHREIVYGPRNLRRPDPDILARAAAALCGLENALGLHPYDLPPAQRKLLALASACAMGTQTLAFDEPTAGVSVAERSIIANACATLLSRQRCLIVASHDIGMFLPLAERLVVLDDGAVAFSGSPGQFSAQLPRMRRFGIRPPLPNRILRIIRSFDTLR